VSAATAKCPAACAAQMIASFMKVIGAIKRFGRACEISIVTIDEGTSADPLVCFFAEGFFKLSLRRLNSILVSDTEIIKFNIP
jgi:hypothetical protein